MTVASMTGAAVARANTEVGSVAIELRSVNARGLAIKTRLAPALHGFEVAIERVVRAGLTRGTVTVVAEVEAASEASAGVVDADRLRGIVAELRRLAAELQVADDLTASSLLAVPGAFRQDAATSRLSRELPPQLRACVERALEELIAARRREGDATARAVRADLDKLAELRLAIAARAPEVVDAYRDGLRRRVDEFLDGRGRAMQDADVLREVALFADRADVGEELQRLDEHVASAVGLLDQGGVMGRQLEFTLQEMLREINTTGSKLADAQVARAVVDMKAAVERVREQAANLE